MKRQEVTWMDEKQKVTTLNVSDENGNVLVIVSGINENKIQQYKNYPLRNMVLLDSLTLCRGNITYVNFDVYQWNLKYIKEDVHQIIYRGNWNTIKTFILAYDLPIDRSVLEDPNARREIPKEQPSAKDADIIVTILNEIEEHYPWDELWMLEIIRRAKNSKSVEEKEEEGANQINTFTNRQVPFAAWLLFARIGFICGLILLLVFYPEDTIVLHRNIINISAGILFLWIYSLTELFTLIFILRKRKFE